MSQHPNARLTPRGRRLLCERVGGGMRVADAARMAGVSRQTSDISAVLTRLNAERAELANGVDNEHPALVAFMKYQNIETLNREILVELVDYIKVYENGNISVKFKFADELRKIAEYIEINTTEDTAVAG